MDTLQKLTILADAAKYDVACTSSGADKTPVPVESAVLPPPASAIPLQPMADVFRC